MVITSDCDQNQVLRLGTQNRAVGVTNMNAHSSRSHLVCILALRVDDPSRKQASRSKLILVDLAGSERVSTERNQAQAQCGECCVYEPPAQSSIGRRLHRGRWR